MPCYDAKDLVGDCGSVISTCEDNHHLNIGNHEQELAAISFGYEGFDRTSGNTEAIQPPAKPVSFVSKLRADRFSDPFRRQYLNSVPHPTVQVQLTDLGQITGSKTKTCMCLRQSCLCPPPITLTDAQRSKEIFVSESICVQAGNILDNPRKKNCASAIVVKSSAGFVRHVR